MDQGQGGQGDERKYSWCRRHHEEDEEVVLLPVDDIMELECDYKRKYEVLEVAFHESE